MFENITSDAARIERRRAIVEAGRTHRCIPARRTMRETLAGLVRYHLPTARTLR